MSRVIKATTTAAAEWDKLMAKFNTGAQQPKNKKEVTHNDSTKS